MYILSRKIERVTIRIQRLWRINLLKRAIKWLFQTKYAVLQIQRVVRGRFGRSYAALVRKLYPIAASRIQYCYRIIKARKLRKNWQVMQDI